ncbi:MAG: ATP:cob(I)alamin adenosyltransferase [Candidatus Shapirobacteria bacterium]|jgi:cob(I)alamin adenosyltransferase
MITTKTGDKGQTTCGNQRIDKDDLLVEVVGSIDELQSILELIGVEKKIVDDLSGIMGELGGGVKFKIDHLKIDKDFNLNKFLKFKSKKALKLNWARTVCRRVERRMVSLNREQKIDKKMLVYFNRLSDYLFLEAVKQNKQ